MWPRAMTTRTEAAELDFRCPHNLDLLEERLYSGSVPMGRGILMEKSTVMKRVALERSLMNTPVDWGKLRGPGLAVATY